MRLLQSFLFAFNGLKHSFWHEKNFRIELVVAIMVILSGIIFSLNKMEWIAVLLCMGLVLCLEIVNSAIESVCDFICPAIDPSIKKIKDLSAAAVLLAVIISTIIGGIIFIPKICGLFSGINN